MSYQTLPKVDCHSRRSWATSPVAGRFALTPLPPAVSSRSFLLVREVDDHREAGRPQGAVEPAERPARGVELFGALGVAGVVGLHDVAIFLVDHPHAGGLHALRVQLTDAVGEPLANLQGLAQVQRLAVGGKRPLNPTLRGLK